MVSNKMGFDGGMLKVCPVANYDFTFEVIYEFLFQVGDSNCVDQMVH